MAPCGIIVHASGPYPGSFHDSKMLSESGLKNQLETSATFSSPGERAFHLYGDQAYRSGTHIISPFKGYTLTPAETECNKIMSKLRISVEWGFGKISQLFAFTEFAENQKIRLQPVGVYYLVAILLTNVHTCLNGSNTSSYFNCEPPSVQQYLTK